ncbi:hypothetical protein C2S52_022445 [Perilla frutescens var. hirtella]|nr:hypothetical protein C2S52_022445 [Perilla frutescens var. hirtella]
MIDSHSLRQTVCTSDPNDGVVGSSECAVCLCRIGVGDEIRRLKCSHVFHRVCFDRWAGYGRWTCPLCRNHLTNLRGSDGGGRDARREILVFSFAEVSSSENKDSWWLR